MLLNRNKFKPVWRGLAVCMALAASVVQAQTAAASSPSQKLVFCSEGSPEFFGPSISTTGTSLDANMPIYDTLVRHIRGSTRLAPGLAERWEVSRDGKEYTFFLRRGVRWHRNALFEPTREFNADDVLFTFNRQWKTNDPYHQVNSSNHAFFNSLGIGAFIKRADKLDDYTIRFTLNEPKVAFLSMFALPFMGVQSYEYAVSLIRQGVPEQIDHQPIGTGPFYWVGYEPDQRIRYRAFDDYWRGRARLDVLEFFITPNPQERWERMQRNECQLMPFPHPGDLPHMRAHGDVTVFQQPGLNVSYLAFNTTKPPFTDVRVRRALNMAVNKPALVERVFQGTGEPAVSLIPPTFWSHNSQLQDEPYNPAEARRLLAEAGFPNGFSTDFWVMPITRGYNPNPQLMGQIIAQDLSRVGVQVNIKTDEWGEYYRRMTQGEHSMGLLGWTGSHGDPDYFFYNLLSCEAAQDGGSNVAKFCNPAYDRLVTRARSIANPALRIPLYEEAQRIFKEQAPWLPIAHAVQTVVYRNEVVNFRASPFGLHDFYGVELKREP